jgi:hypothetical protein
MTKLTAKDYNVPRPLVSVITATTGKPALAKCLASVMRQTYRPIQHLVFVDGPRHRVAADATLAPFAACDPFAPGGESEGYRIERVDLPFPVGLDRWNGHRIYGAGSYLADGECVLFLDDDNHLEPTHVTDCMKVIEAGNDWAYSLRRLVSPEGVDLGYDDCESLGKWPSVLHPEDYFIDVNCYFLKRAVAIAASPIWFRKAREPGQMEVDRVLRKVLGERLFPRFDCTYGYSVVYTVGSSRLSVQPEFFERGNAEMLRRYGGTLPWKRSAAEKQAGGELQRSSAA